MRILPSHRTVLILQAPKLEQLGTRSRSSGLVSTYKKARKTKVTNTPYLIRPRISARPEHKAYHIPTLTVDAFARGKRV